MYIEIDESLLSDAGKLPEGDYEATVEEAFCAESKNGNQYIRIVVSIQQNGSSHKVGAAIFPDSKGIRHVLSALGILQKVKELKRIDDETLASTVGRRVKVKIKDDPVRRQPKIALWLGPADEGGVAREGGSLPPVPAAPTKNTDPKGVDIQKLAEMIKQLPPSKLADLDGKSGVSYKKAYWYFDGESWKDIPAEVMSILESEAIPF